VVHETDLIIAKRDRASTKEKASHCSLVAYLRIQVIDLLNGDLNISRVDRAANLYSFLNRPNIGFRLDVGLYGKPFGSCRIAVGDEVVHDKIVDITSNATVSRSGHDKPKKQ
jgi:hypothetical protein